MILYFKEEDMAYASGCIIVGFEETETRESATKLIESLGLEVKNWGKYDLRTLVVVPVGEEQHWIDKMKSYPVVRYAELNLICCLS